MAATQPNIILITTDQQRYDTAGAAAPPFMRTPHFDQLAREGITFPRAYTSCPICVPSRVSIMTGQNVYSHGMTHNGATSDVLGRDHTLPARLRTCGYQTAAIGKMHFTPQRTRHGFDEMLLPDDYYRQMQRDGHSVQPMRHGLGQNEIYPSMSTVPEAQTLTSWIAEQSALYVLTRRDPAVPFFLWSSFSKPHPPLDPPEPYYSMYRDCDIPEPVIGNWRNGDDCPAVFRREQTIWDADQLDPQTIRAARSAYYGLITQVNYNIGRIIAALSESGLYRETLIIYASDHGEMIGDHRAQAKTYFYEPSAHVPLVVRLPQSWEDRHHGQQCAALADLSDILPTLLKAAGGDVPAEINGMDLVGVARGQIPPRDYLEGMVAGVGQPQGGVNFIAQWGTFYQAITDGQWKYIWYPEGGCEQLFNIETDPAEATNLVEKHPDHRDRLRDELIRRRGDLQQRPVLDINEHDLRNIYRLGCTMEISDHDIRH